MDEKPEDTMFVEVMFEIFSRLDGLEVSRKDDTLKLSVGDEVLAEIKETENKKLGHILKITIPIAGDYGMVQNYGLDKFNDPDYDPREDIMALGNIIFSGVFGGPFRWTAALHNLLYEDGK